LALSAISLSANQAEAGAQPLSLVFLNNVPSAVSFNDGDSFKIIRGSPKGTNARLAGFNTLESHGPVHQWGDWTFKELYVNAKTATLNARRGVWHCSSDMDTDSYGRILWICPDLAEDQVRKGLAHAMSVTEEPAPPRIVAAMHEAILARRGMWAKGVPTYVMTSIHSADEAGARPGRTSNRLVNTVDGHSKKWVHNIAFKECEVVCHQAVELPQKDALALASQLRQDPEIAPMISGIPDILVALSINTFVQHGLAPKIFGAHQEKFTATLETLKAEGRFNAARKIQASCGIHVEFQRRYMRPKPACLTWN